MNSIWEYTPDGAQHHTGLTRPRADELFADLTDELATEGHGVGFGVKLMSTTGKVLAHHKGK